MSNNPLLDGFKLPGRIFQLPSKGVFYKNGELADNIIDGEIHVQALAAVDEIILKNPDQLFSGEAINTVFKNCVRGVEKPSELLAKDVDAIMVFLRSVTYGDSFEFTAKHSCTNGKEHSYTADLAQIINDMKMLDATVVSSMYEVTLQNGQVVKLQPNRYMQVLNLVKANQNKTSISAEDEKRNLKMMLLGVIASVSGVTDTGHIEEWIGKLSTPMVNKIGDKIESINDWGTRMRWTCKCKDCGEDFTVEIPINPVSFFTE